MLLVLTHASPAKTLYRTALPVSMPGTSQVTNYGPYVSHREALGPISAPKGRPMRQSRLSQLALTVV